MSAPRRPFWMICRQPNGPLSRTEPKARFSTFDAARDRAVQLARDAQAPFVILEAVETVRPDDRQTGRLL